MDEYQKYTEMPDVVLRSLLESQYKKEFKKGYFISDIVKLDHNWIIKWKKDLKQ